MSYGGYSNFSTQGIGAVTAVGKDFPASDAAPAHCWVDLRFVADPARPHPPVHQVSMVEPVAWQAYEALARWAVLRDPIRACTLPMDLARRLGVDDELDEVIADLLSEDPGPVPPAA